MMIDLPKFLGGKVRLFQFYSTHDERVKSTVLVLLCSILLAILKHNTRLIILSSVKLYQVERPAGSVSYQH
jgi:hypothetical protein